MLPGQNPALFTVTPLFSESLHKTRSQHAPLRERHRLTRMSTPQANRPLNHLFRMAVVAGVESATKIHIQRGDDVNARDASGLTPLMLAAMRNKPVICALLLSSGADPSLVDSSGKDALSHARQAKADASISEIQSAIDLTRPERHSTSMPNMVPETMPDLPEEPVITAVVESFRNRDPFNIPVSVTLNDFDNLPLICDPIAPTLQAFTPPIDVDFEPIPFELSDWEPEVDPLHGADDPILADGAATVQIAITNHSPVDSSSNWDDLDVYLPLTSAPLSRSNDAEAKVTLRLLLLRALREGSVPDLAVMDMATNDDLSANEASEALLRMVINDLGAETDERLEALEGNDLLEVITSADESPDEEELISDAMAFIDTHESNRNAPLLLYQREFQRGKLITAEEEVMLAKSMEHSIAKAMDALAAWPQGLTHVIAFSELVQSGEKPIQWFTSGALDESPDENTHLDGAEALFDVTDENEPEAESDRKTKPPELTSVDVFERIATLSKLLTVGGGVPNINELRTTLVSMSLKISFLLGMLEHSDGDKSSPARFYSLAMSDYLEARDRMATANLKLVASIAKKFFYTGVPMEDLIQDGNIGLLKAVEKFDWRKGFRFSTMATWWIRQSIHRAVWDTARTIRLPVHILETVQKLDRASIQFEQVNGRSPSKVEIAEIMSLPPNKVGALMRFSQETESIDIQTIDGLITPSSISDFSTPDPFDVIAAADLPRVMNVMLSELDRQHERIIRLRFGIGVTDSFTLEEIGSQYGVTRERIRQIETKGMRILKHPHRVEKLQGMLFGNRQLTPVAHKVEYQSSDDDFDIGDSPPPPKNKASSLPTATNPDSPTKAQNRRGSTFHRLMTQALQMGVDITMDRESTSGTTWVDVKGLPDDRHRKLIRKLLAIGFKHWPGKGYWR